MSDIVERVAPRVKKDMPDPATRWIHEKVFGTPDVEVDPIPTLDEPTPTMPTPNDADVRRKRRRSVAEQRARSGRAATIFSEGYGLGG